MTHEKLLGYTAAELATFDEAKLNVIYASALNITRPDRIVKPEPKAPSASSRQKAKVAETMDLLKAAGLNLDLGM